MGDPRTGVTTLTFDLFGTVFDLSGSLVPFIGEFLEGRGAGLDGPTFWSQWRARQRIEQYQDNIIMLGHSGYLETSRRALLYTLRDCGARFEVSEADAFMRHWRELHPFDDAVKGMRRLGERFRLVALSNGERDLLDHLVTERLKVPMDRVISVQEAGAFKPHPAVYRSATRILDAEPGEIMMVAAHSFDIMGARACGFRGAYVNRYSLPFEETPFQPDVEVGDFIELASYLMGE